ncbi:MAG: glycosyltransferase family 39 protein [Thauera sp.]|nr:glycosyltransferase family 39 protein [Thauera sp.]
MSGFARTASKADWVPAAPVALSDNRLWVAAATVLLLSLVQRLYFYTGFYGSDEVTYLGAAVRALSGDFSPTNYIGSIRYGFQLPIAGLMYVFGQTEVVANLWTLSCSIAEIALLILIGNRIVGLRAAALGGLLLGTLPLHVHYAGRLMADPPLALFMTATFLLFWLGQKSGRPFHFLLAGLAAGMVLWIKESTVVFLAIFLTFPVVFRCWNWRWGWMLLGFGAMVGANLLFFNAVAGDPLYAFRIAGGSVSAYSGDDARFASVIDSPLFYPQYLFAKPYHTWLLGYLALAGLLVWARSKHARAEGSDSTGFVVWWSMGMLLLFSLLPVALAPLKLITKQVNYMLMFMAPLALLGGVALAKLKGRSLSAAMVLIIVPAAVLSALEKNVVAVFTANSKATVAFAKQNSGASVYGAIGAQRAANFDALVDPQGQTVRIQAMTGSMNEVGRAGPAYVVFDSETADWGYSRGWARAQAPSCWEPSGTLDAAPELAMPYIFQFFKALAARLPGSIAEKVRGPLSAMTQQKPAYIFRVPGGGCSGASAS